MIRKLYLGLALCLAMTVTGPAIAADYPAKPVRVVVPFPPGGTTDVLARIVAAGLSERMGQQFIIDNRPGASGAIGTTMVAKAPPDGYTLVFATINTHGINASLFPNLPYDPIKDFAPVTIVANTPNVLMVHPSVSAKNLTELIALAKAEPGRLNFGSTSLGGSPHMSGELFKMMAQVDIVHVPYKGGGPMLTDLIGGHIQMAFDNLPSSMGHIRAGDVRAIAVTTAERLPSAPDIPTMRESGLPDYEVAAWFGLLAPAGTPPEIVERLHKNISEILQSPEGGKRLADLGAEPVGNTPEEFAGVITYEVARWRKVVQATGVKVE
jgi:tripartite-type tricarboxylate transporter receptor subunit TctC